MMKYVMAAAVIATLPVTATAQDRMTRTSCQNAFERAAELVSPNDPTVELQIQYTRITPNGWCQFRKQDPGFEDMGFETIDWRIEGATAWARDGVPPTAVEIRISGLEPSELQNGVSNNAPPLTVEAIVRQDPQAGLLIIESAVMANGAGDILSVSGVYERVYLTSPSMIQVSMGSIAFKAGLMSMTLEGTHENPFGFYGDVEVDGTPQALSEVAFETISTLPAGLVDDASRAELMAFSADLPKPVGTLEVNVASERGLGIMQLGAAMYSSFAGVLEDGAISNEMEILFDGLSVDANWSPAAQSTD